MTQSTSHEICIILLCFVLLWLHYQLLVVSCDVCTYSCQGCLTGIWAIVRLPRYQWRNPVDYGLNRILPKQNKVSISCIFLALCSKHNTYTLYLFVCLFVSLLSHFWLIHFFSPTPALSTIYSISVNICDALTELMTTLSSHQRMSLWQNMASDYKVGIMTTISFQCLTHHLHITAIVVNYGISNTIVLEIP